MIMEWLPIQTVQETARAVVYGNHSTSSGLRTVARTDAITGVRSAMVFTLKNGLEPTQVSGAKPLRLTTIVMGLVSVAMESPRKFTTTCSKNKIMSALSVGVSKKGRY